MEDLHQRKKMRLIDIDTSTVHACVRACACAAVLGLYRFQVPQLDHRRPCDAPLPFNGFAILGNLSGGPGGQSRTSEDWATPAVGMAGDRERAPGGGPAPPHPRSTEAQGTAGAGQGGAGPGAWPRWGRQGGTLSTGKGHQRGGGGWAAWSALRSVTFSPGGRGGRCGWSAGWGRTQQGTAEAAPQVICQLNCPM